jgi:hypothetical protein
MRELLLGINRRHSFLELLADKLFDFIHHPFDGISRDRARISAVRSAEQAGLGFSLKGGQRSGDIIVHHPRIILRMMHEMREDHLAPAPPCLEIARNFDEMGPRLRRTTAVTTEHSAAASIPLASSTS